MLAGAAEDAKNRFSRPSTIVEELKPDAEPQIDIEQVSIWNLLDAFNSIMEATGAGLDISHITDDTPIDLYQIEILHRLQTEGAMSFKRIFESKTSRVIMIGLFLALLELIREKLVWVEQPKASASIYLRALTDEPAEQAVQKGTIAAEAAGKQSSQIQQHEKPHIPITELPPKSQPTASPTEYEKIDSAEDHKKQTAN